MLFLFAFNVPLSEFTCMLGIFILHDNKFLSHQLHSRWDCVMLQYAMIAGLIQLALHLVPIANFAISKSPLLHNRASSMLYGWCNTAGSSSFTNSSPHIYPPIWVKDFELWLVSSKDFIPLLYCPVFVRLDQLEPFHTVFLSQQWFLDASSAI